MICPRCKKEVGPYEKYCRHCGFDLTKHMVKNKNKKMMMFFLVPFLAIAVPAFSMKYFDKIARELENINTSEIELQDVAGYAPTYIVKTYTSLEEFDGQFSNVESIVEGIRAFEESLSQDGLYEVKYSYKIDLLDNLNINYYLSYDIQINDRLTLTVDKSFDRLDLFNDEVYSFVTSETNEFQDLLLNEEELNKVTSFIKGEEITDRLVNDFSNREEEFELKKDNLGHYGIGNYEGDYSFVTYKKGDAFYSKLKYNTEAKELIK